MSIISKWIQQLEETEADSIGIEQDIKRNGTKYHISVKIKVQEKAKKIQAKPELKEMIGFERYRVKNIKEIYEIAKNETIIWDCVKGVGEGKTKYIVGITNYPERLMHRAESVNECSPYVSLVLGALYAIHQIKKSGKVVIISNAGLGLLKYFKGKNSHQELLHSLATYCMEKRIQIVEVYWPGADIERIIEEHIIT